MFQWPLRFGTMPGDEIAWNAVEKARGRWPSSHLSKAYELTRDQPRCDLFVFSGTALDLIDQLRQDRFRRKARVLMIGNEPQDPLRPGVGLVEAMKRCDVDVSTFLPPHKNPDGLGDVLNEIVIQLSHNNTLGEALASSGLAMVWRRPETAEFQLLDVARRINRNSIELSRLGTEGLPFRAREVMRVRDPGSVFGFDRRRIGINLSRLDFGGEGKSASDLAEISEAIAVAPVRRSVEKSRAQRHLQQHSTRWIGGEYRDAVDGFVLGTRTKVRMRIGPSSPNWQGLAQAFPDEKLLFAESWTLRVWFTEPDQLEMPLHADIELPADGPSEATTFTFVPRTTGTFDARITVTHRGRVLQTARFLAGVRGNEEEPVAADAEPKLTELLPVRRRIGDLDQRRPFDLSFVTNHASNGQPRAVALADDHAWIADISGALKTVETLNHSLSKVAKLVADYADGLDGELGRELMVDLARQGAVLQRLLVIEQLRNPHNRPEIAEHEYIQIISTRNDHEPVPFEFIYDYEVPARAAKPCAHWRKALTDGACPGTCRGGDEFVVCPMGFWGMRKVIERHQLRADLATTGREFLLQSEPGRESSELTIGTEVLVAASKRVQQADFEQVVARINSHAGKHARPAPDWTAWEKVVSTSQPTFILSMPHTDGLAASISLEIGGVAREALDIRLRHVRASTNGLPPLVALIGCDTGTAHSYGEYLQVFRQHGAAVVLGTIATVFGGHAARVASLLADELYRDSEQAVRLGEALRNIKRRALLEGLFMPMCLVAYGDADWRLVH